MAQPRILIADDEPEVLVWLKDCLGSKPWTVETASDGQEALDLLCSVRFDVAVLDLKMPRLNGVEVLQAIRQQGIRTDVIILTGYATVESSVEAMKLGADDYLEKPISPHSLVTAIHHLLETHCSSPHVLAERLDAYVRDHACDTTLRLSDLMDRFNISMSYACKLFREHIGCTFRQYLGHHRIQKARQLIETTHYPLYTIAELCGFRSQQHFRDVFFRTEGMCPRKYRENCGDRQ